MEPRCHREREDGTSIAAPPRQRYLGLMLLRVQGLIQEGDGQFVAVALGETSGRELVSISDEKAHAIRVEFERELPRITASAAAGFPVPEAIPIEIHEPSAELGQQICPNCPHPMSMHTGMGCRVCPCSRPG